MDNISDIVDEKTVHEERGSGANSPDSGEAAAHLYSEVQVYTYADGERASPDYMNIRDREEPERRSSSSSSSSSDDEQEKAEEEAAKSAQVESVEEVSEAHNGSRRSSTSSASSASAGDPCNDPPIHIYDEVSVDYSLKTLENVTLDESSAAPADPSQPEITLFVKVRNLYSWAIFIGCS